MLRPHLPMLIACAALVASAGCKEPEPAPAPAAGSSAGSARAEAAPPAAPTPAPDPGPLLKRTTGKRAGEALPALTVSAQARATAGGATYLQVAMPEGGARLPTGPFHEARLIVEGDRPALAVPGAEGMVQGQPLMHIRLAGEAPPPDPLTVRWHQPAIQSGEPGRWQVLTVTGGAAAPADGAAPKRFHEAASRWFDQRGRLGTFRTEPFYTFAGARLSLLAEGGGRLSANQPMQRRRGEVEDLMRLYTGMTSVDEALQHDRGLLLPPDADTTQKIPLAEVEPVRLTIHPWDKMIADLGRQPVVEPLAAYAPADALYVHFHDLRTLVKLANELDEMVHPVARALEERPGARHFAERYERQLAVERLGLAERLGHLAADGVALVAGDPFFREGTDLALLFRVRNAALLDGAITAYEARARERRPDARDSTYTVGTHEVRLLSTDDRVVHQHRLKIDDVLVVANSRATIERIVAAREGRVPALKDSGEYRYFRAVYPFGKETEDGFLFASDAFVAHVISPRVKVLQSRRMAAQADLFAVSYAALLYGWLEGRPPKDAGELVAASLLRKDELAHQDGSGEIRFDPQRGASSEAWGRPEALRPLAELPLDKVTEREQGAYNRFRESYQRYWTGYIDPIGVRVRRLDDGLAVEARMMPLIQQSDYAELERLVGDRRIVPPPSADGVRFTIAVAPDSPLRREVDQLGRAVIGRRDVGLEWLGEWVMLGFADRSGLWDGALAVGEIPSAEGTQTYRDLGNRRKVLDRFPVYVGAHVKNRLTLAATIAALKGFVQSAAPDVVDWKEGEPYRDVGIVDISERILDPGEEGAGATLHYAIARDVFLLSLDRSTLLAQIDAVLDGRVAAAKPEKDAPEDAAQSVLAIRPGAAEGWLVKTIAGLLERGTMSSNRSARRAFEALAVGRGGLPAEDAERRRLALDWLGYEPLSANGGRFELGPDGLVRHDIYGTEVEPVWPDLPVPGAPVTDFLKSLEELRMTVSFEGEGATRGLRTTILWDRR